MAQSVINSQSLTLPEVDLSSIKNLLQLLVDRNGSDLHISADYPPTLRIDGALCPVGTTPLSKDQASALIKETMTTEHIEKLGKNLEIDYSFGLGNIARFRVNAFYERGNLAAAFRHIPSQIKTMEELRLPRAVQYIPDLVQGFVLLTGPTGSGKSTTLASIIEKINTTQTRRIITVEDPIEYLYTPKKSFISQREIGHDTKDWDVALVSALREDPEVVLIGEMRDYKTIAAALTIAETGHLVFATLHTNNASQSIDRIMDVFPSDQQNQVRIQLSGVLQAIISQRLVPIKSGGRRAVCEVLVANSAIKNLIRENKTYQIDNVISTSIELGMVTMEQSLVNLIREGLITVEEAQQYTVNPDEILRLLKMNKGF